MSAGYRPLAVLPSPEKNAPSPPSLVTRQDAPPSNKPNPPKNPLPTLSDGATFAIIFAIFGAAVIILLLTWWLRQRARRRAAAKANSGAAKWDPSPPSTPPPSRSWVDVDVERVAGRRTARVEGGAEGYRGRIRGAPRWNAVAERVSQHERGRARGEAVGPAAQLFHLPGPPLAVTRRPTNDGSGRSAPPKDEPRVAMLWAPGQRPARPRAPVSAERKELF